MVGDLADGKVALNANGSIVYEHWHRIPEHYLHVHAHTFTIMPDHVHGVIELTDRPARKGVQPWLGQRPLGPAPGSLGAIVGSYRAGVVRDMNRLRMLPVHTLWQRGYYDIIILNDRMLERINAYIQRHPTMVLPDH